MTDPRGDLNRVDIEQISGIMYHLNAYGASTTALNNLSNSTFLMVAHVNEHKWLT